ncbi:sulfatase [Sinomicrobium weinanense]|uniref:Sulfatase n=1 Tax=Sinomicrobium weinanense TaxID=2842200 RepID=A0A926JT76_9FLAO|nr:sulfatase [Sinomicrobium weinanense]MBC9797085.1 sulfatase [Sinomicrobium weinanense]MBU3122686.1 sulfatase [Sinomicrobium weinanense]
MKKFTFMLPVLLLHFGMPWHIWPQAEKKPNIIVFLVDDMGWQDTSVPFWARETPLNRKYHTPNMERLARQGMKFTNAYATSVCTPTRVSMLTGMNAAHHRVTNWTSPKANNNTDYPDQQFGPADWNFNGLSPAPGVDHTIYATPLPQLLKKAGYYTIHIGKAHFGSDGTPGSDPLNLGFMVNIAGHAAGHPQSYLGEKNFGNIPGKAGWQAVPGLKEYHGKDIFLTEALTQEAIRAIEKPVSEEQPFFLNMAHYAVHVPLDKDKRFYKKYIAAGLEEKEARYAALIEGMDKSLGDLMDYLKARKIEDNTVIIFMSDNGGLSLAPPRGGVPHTHNLPLKAGKGSLYEGGIRVPMIAKWKGKIKAGTVTKYGVMIEDYFPTILEIAGVTSPNTVQQIDGKSFVHMLKTPALIDSTRTFIWHTPNKWIPDNGPGINYKSAIRQGAWKLIYNMRNRSLELYNLHEDLGETTDLAEQYPEKVKQLSALLSKQLREWKAPMPLIKNSGRSVPLPSKP